MTKQTVAATVAEVVVAAVSVLVEAVVMMTVVAKAAVTSPTGDEEFLQTGVAIADGALRAVSRARDT